MKGTALVVGADGLLGRSLVARLTDLPEVTVRPVTRADGDLRLADNWEGLPPADHVFQLAARTFVPDSGIIRTSSCRTTSRLRRTRWNIAGGMDPR